MAASGSDAAAPPSCRREDSEPAGRCKRFPVRTLLRGGTQGLMGVTVKPAHCPECSHSKPRVFLRCYTDKLDPGQRKARESGAAVCVSGSSSAHICFPALEHGMMPEGSQLEKERWRKREGVCVLGGWRRKTGNEDQHRAWNVGKWHI